MARLSPLRRWLVPAAVLVAAVRCGGGDGVVLPSEQLPAHISAVLGDAQQGFVGQPLADSLVVSVTDTKGSPVQNARVVFQQVAGGTGGDLIPDTAVTDANGRAWSRWVLGTLSGQQRVEARVLPPLAGAALKQSFTATALPGAPDTAFSVLGDGQTAPVGSVLVDSLVVLVTDQFGNPTGGWDVQWSVPSGEGSVSAATVTTGSDGRAAVTRTLGLTAGTQTATATVGSVKGSPITFTSHASAGGAVTAVKLFGDLQTAPAGFQLTDSVVVQVQDINGNGVAGRNVNWVVTDGGSVTPLTSTTDAQGKAFAYWTLRATAGANQLTAAAAGLPQLHFTATGTAAQPAQIVAQSATTISGTAGAGVSAKPSVKVTDANNNPVQGLTVTFLVTAGGGTVSDPNGSGTSVTVATNASGIATLTAWTLGPVAGVGNTVTATATGSGIGGNPVTFNASALAGPAAQLVIQTEPAATALSGVTLSQQPTLQLRDALGNAVAQSGVTVTASVVGAGAQLRGTTTATTNASGLASFGTLALGGTVGSYALAFSAGALTPDTSTAIVLSAGPAARLVVATQPSASAQSGVAFAVQPAVQVQDADGNPVAVSGVGVTAAIATGGGTLGGTVTATTSGTGLATFSNLSITGAAGSRTLSFSAIGLTSATSSGITLGAGAATQLGITTQPSASAQSGSVLAQQPVVELRDGTGNAVPQAGVSITATLTGAPAGVTLGGVTTVQTTGAGLASFTGLSLSGTAGSYTLTFSVTAGATGVAPVTSTSIALAAGTGTALTITTQPAATGQSGVALSPAAVVQLRDGSGNAVNQAGVAIAASIASGANGTLGGTDTVLTASNGTATFSNLVITGTVGSYTLAFSGSGLTGVTATSTMLSAGPAAKLAIATAPASTAQSGIALTTQPALQLQDGAGNSVSQAGVVVTASIASGGGSLGGTLTATTGGTGLASFTNLTISGTAGPRTLDFSATGLTKATSGTITLSAGAAALLAKVAGDGQSATAGSQVPINPQVRVTDASGNPVAGVTVSFAVTAGGGSAAASQVTDAAGLASVSWTLGPVAGGNTLTASAVLAGGSSTVTFTATGTAGTAGKLAMITQPSASAASGAVLAQQPTVQLQDQNGNNVTTSNVPITAQSSATLGGTVTVLTVNGVATFTNLSLTGLAGSYTLTFTGTNLTGVSSSAITLTAGAASRLVVTTQPPASAQSGVAFAPQPAVQVQDAAGNPVSGTRTITASFQTGSGSLIGGTTASTGGGSTATFGTLGISGTVGTYALNFTSGLLVPDTSNSIAITAGSAQSIVANSATTQTTTVGSAVAAPPSVLVKDGAGNPLPGVTVTFAITAGTAGSLVGATQVTNGSGIATVTSWIVDTTVKTNTVTATATGAGIGGNPVAFTATGTAGLATKLIMNRQPSTTAQSGVAVVTTPRVQVADQYNNAVTTTPGVVITVSVASGPGGSPVLTPVTATTSSSGLATYTGFTLTGLVGSYTFQFDATAAGLGTVSSGTLTLSAGTASGLTITTQPPAAATSGAALSPPPAVQLVDGAGNLVTTSGNGITATIASGPIGGTLSNSSAATVNGLATFTGLVLTGSTGSYTLSFAGIGISAVVSNTIALSAGGGSKLAMQTQPSATAASGQIFAQQPVIQLQDAVGNPVSTPGVNVTAQLTGAPVGVTLGGTTTATTNGNGQASFTNLSISGPTGSRTLDFSASSFVTVTSSAIAITAGTPSSVTIQQQPSATAQNTVAFATQPTALVKDLSNNPVPNTVVTASLATGAGTLGGTLTATTNSSGVASFTSLEITGATGARTLRLTAGSASATTGTVTITAGPASGPQSTATVPAGAVAASTAIAIQARDVSGNLVTTGGATVVVTVTGANSATPTVTDNGDGTYSASYTPAAGGSDQVAITLNGAAISGSPFTSAVSAAATTTTVSTNPPTTQVGGSYSVDVTVAAVLPAAGTPTGTVNVSDGVGGTCTASLAGGQGSCSLSTLAIGGHTITASYVGTATFSPSSGTASHTVTLLGSTTSITTNTPNPSVIGQPVSVNVTVTSLLGTPGGTVGVTDGATSCVATLASGSGSCTLTFPTAGARTLTATYSGDATHGGSSDTAPQTVNAFGSADHVSFTVQPGTTTAGVVIAPAVEVSILDAFGNLVTSATDQVSVKIGNDGAPGGGSVLSGTVDVNAIGGVASFSDLSIDLPGVGFTLSAGSGSLGGDTSTVFDIQ